MAQYKYNQDLKELLNLLPKSFDFSSVESIQALRQGSLSLSASPSSRSDVRTETRSLEAITESPEIEFRIYTPTRSAKVARSCVFEIHGGGFMLGSKDEMDPWCERVCAETDSVVISTDYRLAPEDPFPAGLEDCYRVLCWIADHAQALGIDLERLAIAGQSAGGGLAAACALMARDRGGPKLCFQMLEIPELDDRLETPSMQQFTDTPLWNRPSAEWSWRHYLGPDHSGEVSAYAAPARAEDLSGLPPAYVSTMEFDPLRDEGILYALRLLQAGIPVELHNYPGTFHGSTLVGSAESSLRNADEVIHAFKMRFSQS
ncbi:MAG: esterase [Deltaproteobacteria bacterium]|nr:esterase [Deltaproteobacteria bacterium]